MTNSKAMQSISVILVAMLLTVLSEGNAIAQSSSDETVDRRWHIGVSTGMVFEDSQRQINDDQPYAYGLNFGRMLTRNIGIDFQFDRYSMDFDLPAVAANPKTRQITYGVYGRYYFRPSEATQPFVLVGTGIQDHDNAFDSGRDIFASAGLGIQHRYSDHVSFRVQGEVRYDNDRETFNRSTGFTDFIISAGFNFDIGSKPVSRPARSVAPAVRPVAPKPAPMFAFDAMVLFEFDSASLRPEAQQSLQQAAQTLNRHNELVLIEVGGHTCDLGSAAYNENLSRERAEAVYDYLVDSGVAAARLEVRAYGETSPRVPNSTQANREQNRRVELTVLQRKNP